MPDFRAYIRKNLPPLGVSGAQEAEIVEELALELEEHYQRAISAGLDPEAAWRLTRQAVQWERLASDIRSVFGDDEVPGAPPSVGKSHLLSNVLHDIRYGLRLLAKSPGFTIAAVLTIALGIGPNTAIFSALYGVFWGPTGNINDGRTSVLWATQKEQRGYGVRGGFHASPREYMEWREQSSSFELRVAGAWTRVTLNDDFANHPERIEVQPFTPGHITMLGGRMALGRDILPEEGIEGRHRVLLPPFSISPATQIGLNPTVLLFTIATTAFSGLIFGCAPAWRLARANVGEILKQSGRSGSPRGRHRLGQFLVVTEYALALTLLAGAALVMRSYWERTHADYGVSTERILTFELPVRRERFRTLKANEYNRVLLEKLDATPGVQRAAAVYGLPLAGTGTMRLTIPARPPANPDRPPEFRTRMVSRGFFDTFGVETMTGRRFTEQDRADSMPVAMVNETFVREHLQALEPLRQELLFAGNSQPRRLRIVGVYRDIHNAEQFGGDNRPEVILPVEQFPGAYSSLAVRTARDPEEVRADIAAVVRTIDPEMPMANVRTMRQVVREQTAFDRFEAALYGSFAGLALLLASVGIYGVMAFVVSQRTSEVGVRMALGADRYSIVRMILHDGLKLAIAGLVLGAAGAYYAGRVLQSSLYGTGSVDPIAFAVVALVLVGAALVACLLPARRAARVDPIRSLRAE